MIVIAKNLQEQAPFPFPTIYSGDAAVVVPMLTTVFDIILVDLFIGIEPSPLLLDPVFIQAIKNKLTKNGTVIVNVCLQPNYLTLFKNTFTHAKTWRYELFHSNTFGAFWDEEQ